MLKNYQKELNHNKEIFEKGQKNKVFSKRKPPIAGAIEWKRAIFNRVKNPIIKFIKKAKQWKPDELKLVKEEYKTFAK